MKFGYILPNYGDKISPQELLEISAACEEAGYDSVWATDHVILPREQREPYGQVVEPMTTLAFIASKCDRLTVGTSILILPQRNPVLVAKQAAALDVLSKGRLILGVGVGWAEKEFSFLGADFHRRGKVMDEGIALIRKLWRDEVIDFEGEFFQVSDALFLPKPVRGYIPIWIGGNGTPSVRMVMESGDGWHPVGPELGDFARGAAKIRESKKEVTLSVRMTTDVRKRREVYVGANQEKRAAVSGSSADIRKQIDGYAKAGLEYYCAAINHPAASDIVADIRKFAADVIRSYA
ncbi:MAG: TIGR03619 family F420-dependent LLM class oxidoreductase [Nitrososphaerota archaeon]|nr:TIGR03619 family F420-dependent LLM class oxidoreductase [Nitrososphaerota archaeon]